MTARKLTHWFAACFFLAAGAERAAAQAADAFCEECCEHDMQWFAPVDFDYDCQPIERSCGYFFNYDRLAWAVTGERVTIGTENADDGSLGPWRVFMEGAEFFVDPDDEDVIIILPGEIVNVPPPQVLSGLKNAPPSARFAWGHRYEGGYFNNDEGWAISVLDGPEQFYNEIYGNFTTLTPSNSNLYGNIYGSVQINFDDPQNLMFGFMDVLNQIGSSYQPNGIADDVNINGIYGPDGIDAEDPGRDPDTIVVGLEPDYGDLVRLPTSWRFVNVQTNTQTTGVELMRTHRLSNLHKMDKHQNNTVELSWGVRFLQLKDDFLVQAVGGVLGDSFWDTSIDNNIVGPQVGINWSHQRKRFRLDVNGRAMMGYNIENFEQTVSLGEHLVPGQYNRPLYFAPTYANHGKQEEEFSPVAELRVQGNYQLTRALALKVGYTAIYIDNIDRAAAHVKYELPNMGFREDAGSQEILINGVNFGGEIVF